jgi:hypothetical protein
MALIVLAPGPDDKLPVGIDHYIQNDGPAADLAIFYVALLGNGIVNQYRDFLTAVRAADGVLGEFGHSITSVARSAGYDKRKWCTSRFTHPLPGSKRSNPRHIIDFVADLRRFYRPNLAVHCIYSALQHT